MIIQAPISMRSNTRIKRFINNTLVPQMILWGMKDGMTDEEINEEIDVQLGKTMRDRINLVKSRKFDDWDVEVLI